MSFAIRSSSRLRLSLAHYCFPVGSVQIFRKEAIALIQIIQLPSGVLRMAVWLLGDVAVCSQIFFRYWGGEGCVALENLVLAESLAAKIAERAKNKSSTGCF